MTGIFPNIGFTRKTLFIGLIVVLVFSNLIIILSEVESREFYSIRIIVLSSIITTILAIFVLFRQRFYHGLLHKADLALAVAMSLSLCAEIVWMVYEVILDIVPPILSLADLLSIAGYAFLAYYVFSTYFRFHKVFHFDPRRMIVAVIASTIFLSYILYITIGVTNFSSTRGIAMFSILVAYPILDAIIMVPSFLIILNYRKEPLWFTPWVCKSAGIFLIALSDSWFAFFVITSLTTDLWPSALIIASHNLILAGGLLWYIKFLVKYKDVDSFLISNKKINNNKDMIYEKKYTLDRNHNSTSSGKSQLNPILLTTVVGVSVLTIIIISVVAMVSAPDSTWTSAIASIFTLDTIHEITPDSSSNNVIKIGAMLSLTGIASSIGKSVNSALGIALDDINNYFSTKNSSIRYELIVEDTESNPSKSLKKLERLDKYGIKIVVGPATSSELQVVKDYANKNDILLVSYSSTAPSLAIEGDNVFRFVPNDTHQAKAISKLMWQEGIRVVVPFWRDDVYGNELMNAVKDDFQKKGGEFYNKSIGYIPKTGELTSSLQRVNFVMWDKDLRTLDSNVQEAIAKYGTDKVGVYLISLDEVTPIFIQAHSYPFLSKVKWYGSDGSVLNEKLVRNHDSAHFAANTSFYNPIYSIDSEKNIILDELMKQIYHETEIEPSPYAAVAYDILWVVALAENQTKFYELHDNNSVITINNNTEKQTMHYLKEELINIANVYNGITGTTRLDNQGDRLESNYDFWAILDVKEKDKQSFKWYKIENIN